MGVSIYVNGECITPGWRSMMYQLLLDEFGSGSPALYEEDIPYLEKLRDNQYKGEKDPPFDWSQDIANSFNKIIDAIKDKGYAAVQSRH